MNRISHDCATSVQYSSETAVTLFDSAPMISSWKLVAAAYFTLAAFVCLASTASGQVAKYDVLEVEKLIDDNLTSVQREASGYATARDISSFPPNRKATIQRYFQQYVPAKITQPDAHYMINDVMGHANSSMQRAVRSRTPGAADVMRWLYGGLKPVALGNYQPAGRINAINFIAQLARPAAARGGVPQPYPFVLTDMKTIYMDQANPDGVRAAALKGIDRFIRYTPAQAVDDAAKQEITAAMTELLEAPAPAGRDKLAHAYLQRYAVNILSNLSTDGSFGKQLVSISINEDNPNLIALHSAAAIASLPGKLEEGDVDTKAVLQQWAKRALETFEAEGARLDVMQKVTTNERSIRQPAAPETYLQETKDPNEKLAARAMGMGGEMEMEMDMEMEMGGMDMEMMEMEMEDMGGMEGMMGMGMMGMRASEPTQPPEVVASRKKLNHALEQILLGVTGSGKTVEDVDTITADAGLMAATPADSMEDLKTWLQSINDVTASVNDTTLATTRTYRKTLAEQSAVLTALANGELASAAAMEEDGIFGLDMFEASEEAAPAGALPAEPGEADDALDAVLN